MQAKMVLPQSIPRSRYMGQTKSGKAPAARDLTKVLVAMALGLYRVKVSTRYWREDWKMVVKPTPVKKTPTMDGQGLETCLEEVPALLVNSSREYPPWTSFNSHPNKNRPAGKAKPPYIMGGSLASGTGLKWFVASFFP